MAGSLVTDAKWIAHSAPAAAAQTAIEPAAGVDCAGFGCCTFVVSFGTITSGSVVDVKAQESTEVDGAVDTFADIKDSNIDVADTNSDKLVVLEVRPLSRYVRCVVTRTTEDAVINGIIAVLTEPRNCGSVLWNTALGPTAVVEGQTFSTTSLGSDVAAAKAAGAKIRGTA